MVTVFAPEAAVHAALRPDSAVAIAAVNGPRLTVVSGPEAQVAECVERVRERHRWVCCLIPPIPGYSRHWLGTLTARLF